jgi:hypothetical protein
MALSLPNVCVYPDSILKFHQAYNIRNRQTDFDISQQLFESYPAAVRARLGTLTREYRVLTGAELIKLGIRDCSAPRNEPRIMVASTSSRSPSQSNAETSIGSIFNGVISAFNKMETGAKANLADQPDTRPTRRETAAKPIETPSPALADFPLPPPRHSASEQAHLAPQLTEGPKTQSEDSLTVTWADVPLPPARPSNLRLAYSRPLPVIVLPKIITGAQPILPTSFTAYAAVGR